MKLSFAYSFLQMFSKVELKSVVFAEFMIALVVFFLCEGAAGGRCWFGLLSSWAFSCLDSQKLDVRQVYWLGLTMFWAFGPIYSSD